MQNKLDYLIKELIKEDSNLSNIEIPNNIDDKKDLYRALRNIRSPKPISEDYLKVQDEYLIEEINNKGIIDEKDIAFDKVIPVFNIDDEMNELLVNIDSKLNNIKITDKQKRKLSVFLEIKYSSQYILILV